MELQNSAGKKASAEELAQSIDIINNSPIIAGLMNILSGLLAVLSEHRQIVALNEAFMESLNIDDCYETLGLRLGDIIGCVHASKSSGGCGTTEYCPSCSAAIAIISSMETDKPVEKTCAVTITKNDVVTDVLFEIRSCPIALEGNQFLVLFLQDITKQQQWATLEKVFFHDISNISGSLVGMSDLLLMETDDNTLAKDINTASQRLAREIEVQKCLFQMGSSSYQPVYENLKVSEVLIEIKQLFSSLYSSRKKELILPDKTPSLTFRTDSSLLLRILNNMIKNAFEASKKGEDVKLSVEYDTEKLTFLVWNKEVIPRHIQKRIFQRNFTTKPGSGRGLGTYSMKLFGEEILGGKVDFKTSQEEGTVFRFQLSTNIHKSH
jgi:signal transduction histidine kinase